MKTALKSVLGMAVLMMAILAVRAEDDKKAETFKGTITCAKCDLGETKVCANVIKTKIDDKEVVLYFKDAGPKAPYHGKVCRAAKEGSVTGVVSEKDGKKWITPAKDGVKFE
jgi:Family of unknown function (DUF6370)